MKIQKMALLLPEYVKLGLSAAVSADRLAQTFADISQEYPPFVIENLPDRIRTILKGKSQHTPYVSSQLVQHLLKSGKQFLFSPITRLQVWSVQVQGFI